MEAERAGGGGGKFVTVMVPGPEQVLWYYVGILVSFFFSPQSKNRLLPQLPTLSTR